MEISLHRTSLQADECGEKLCKAQPPRLCIALYSQLGIQKMDRSLPREAVDQSGSFPGGGTDCLGQSNKDGLL